MVDSWIIYTDYLLRPGEGEERRGLLGSLYASVREEGEREREKRGEDAAKEERVKRREEGSSWFLVRFCERERETDYVPPLPTESSAEPLVAQSSSNRTTPSLLIQQSLPDQELPREESNPLKQGHKRENWREINPGEGEEEQRAREPIPLSRSALFPTTRRCQPDLLLLPRSDLSLPVETTIPTTEPCSSRFQPLPTRKSGCGEERRSRVREEEEAKKRKTRRRPKKR